MASVVNMCFLKTAPTLFSRLITKTDLRVPLILRHSCTLSSSRLTNFHQAQINTQTTATPSCLHFPPSTGDRVLVLRERKRGNCGAHFRLFSTEKPNLTDEILKSKLTPPPPQSEPPPSPPGAAGAEAASGGDGTKQEKKKESWFSGRNAWKFGLASLGVTGIVMCGNILVLWGRPIQDPEGNEIVDEFTELPNWKAYPKRAWKELKIFKKMIQEPSSLKLLPDVLKEPYYQPPYTLVLEMTGVLVHPDWTLGTGWRFKKRPGLDYFLQQVGPPLFEVVIYTHEQGFTAFPIIDGLDPEGRIMFRLFRDATRYMNGTHVKDLACLNRDLSKVIIVDCNPKSFALQPQNAFLLKKWNGEDNDRTLIDLAAFLQTIATSNVEDVRTVLEYYSQFDDPVATFKENRRILQEQEEQARAAVAQKSQKTPSGTWSFGLSGLRRS